jgi:hypothetical protein
MTITNQTLMWLAPLTGGILMLGTTAITNWIDTRRPARANEDPLAKDSGRAAGEGYQSREDAEINQAMDAIKQRLETVMARAKAKP